MYICLERYTSDIYSLYYQSLFKSAFTYLKIRCHKVLSLTTTRPMTFTPD